MTAAPVADQRPPAPEPTPPFPRRIEGTSRGERWELTTSTSGVVATTGHGPVAQALVTEHGEQVVVELWTALGPLPAPVRAGLVAEAFAHPAVRTRRPVLAVVPRGDSDLLDAVRTRVGGASSRVAGVTCLIEGHVGAARPTG
jgi:hypothetical protein